MLTLLKLRRSRMRGKRELFFLLRLSGIIFTLTRTFFSLLFYLDKLNLEDRETSSWHLVLSWGQRVSDGGSPSVAGHTVVVLFWCHRMQIPDLSFFSDSVITGHRVCLWAVPTASYGRIHFSFSLLSSLKPPCP